MQIVDTAPRRGKRILKSFLSILWLLLGIALLHAQDFATPEHVGVPSTGLDARTERFQWKSALVDASIYMGMAQAFRVVQDPKIRRGLRGPFFRDYFNSVRNISGWSDGDRMLTNYVGHPFSGSIVGYIQVRHDPHFRTADFGWTSQYWKSRLRAMGFIAVYSLEFEIGPLGEASIGNIQLNSRKRGIVDWVTTPAFGTAWMAGEDFTDKYLIRAVERRTRNRALLALTRSFLNPTRSLSNLVGRRRPWERDDRPGVTFLAGRTP